MIEQRAAPASWADVPASYADAQRSTIGCVISACNDEASIADIIAAVLRQTRVPDIIHVVVDGTTDATVHVASAFSGPHVASTDLGEQFTRVFVHDIGRSPDRGLGALNYGYSLIEGYDYVLGVNGEVLADPRAVERLEATSVDARPSEGVTFIRLLRGAPGEKI